MNSDLAILNANVVTLDPRNPFSDAIAVKFGKILEEVERVCGVLFLALS